MSITIPPGSFKAKDKAADSTHYVLIKPHSDELSNESEPFKTSSPCREKHHVMVGQPQPLLQDVGTDPREIVAATFESRHSALRNEATTAPHPPHYPVLGPLPPRRLKPLPISEGTSTDD